MDIRLSDGWANTGNHESSYGGDEVKTLVGQVRQLPNIDKVAALPEGIQVFVQKCILGNTPVWVTKGMHERWDKTRADGEVKREASPHIQYKFDNNADGAKAWWLTGHIFLSENFAFTQNTRSGGWDRYEWSTVGVSVDWKNQYHQFPAVFSQEMGNIQYQEGGRRGLKRRNSVGLIVPAEFKTVVTATS